MWVAFAIQKLLIFFSAKNINVFAIFQDRNFNDTLANNFVKFWTTWPWLMLRGLHYQCLESFHDPKDVSAIGFWQIFAYIYITQVLQSKIKHESRDQEFLEAAI